MKEKVEAGSSLIGMAAVIAALHIGRLARPVAIVVPQHLTIGTKPFGIGIAAYMLGDPGMDSSAIIWLLSITRPEG